MKNNGPSHPFEIAGLGKAPFSYVGMVHQDIRYGQAVVGMAGGIPITTAPGGSCAYCGTYIVNMFNVMSADGRVFHVGSDCIYKVAETAQDAATTKIATKVKADLAAQKASRTAKKAVEARAFFAAPETQAHLASKPHPTAFYAGQGKTLKDYHDFCNAHAGDAAIVKAANQVRKQMSGS